MRKLLIFLFIFFLNYSLIYSTNPQNWKVDIDYLKSELPKRHKNLFFQISHEEFSSKLDSLKNELPNMDDIDIALNLQQILSLVGDSHTDISYFKYISNNLKYPIRYYWLKDGLYVIGTIQEYNTILGKKLYSINDIPVNKILDRISTLIPKENEAIIRHRAPNLMVFSQVLNFLKITKGDSAKHIFSNSLGELTNISIKTVNHLSSNTKPIKLISEKLPLCLKHQNTLFWSEYIADKKILYVQYNKCWSKELEQKFGSEERAKNLPSFEKFSSNLINTIQDKKIGKFIFDIRFNPGGSSIQGARLVEKLAKLQQINQKGKVFVIIGRRTFSSAVLNALDFQNLTHALLVGEPTSGKPNHFGEVKQFKLPESGLEINYSTKYFKRSSIDLNSLIPDIMAEMSIEDFKKGIDIAFEAILSY